jgi:hypothetical protein
MIPPLLLTNIGLLMTSSTVLFLAITKQDKPRKISAESPYPEYKSAESDRSLKVSMSNGFNRYVLYREPRLGGFSLYYESYRAPEDGDFVPVKSHRRELGYSLSLSHITFAMDVLIESKEQEGFGVRSESYYDAA